MNETSEPKGLEHLTKEFASLKAKMFIILEHQKEYPELVEKMRHGNATNIYTAFLMMLPLEIKGRLTPDLKRKIMKSYGLI